MIWYREPNQPGWFSDGRASGVKPRSSPGEQRDRPAPPCCALRRVHGPGQRWLAPLGRAPGLLVASPHYPVVGDRRRVLRCRGIGVSHRDSAREPQPESFGPAPAARCDVDLTAHLCGRPTHRQRKDAHVRIRARRPRRRRSAPCRRSAGNPDRSSRCWHDRRSSRSPRSRARPARARP